MRNPLDKTLRGKLENIVGQARKTAEAAANEAINALGVVDAEAPAHLTAETRALRVRLRAHARQLGDKLHADSRQGTDSLVEEIAYEHWHRMLFARFLAENDLLIYDGIAITLADCAELAEEAHCDSPWELAANCAAKMLPQIFRVDSPAFELELAPNRLRELERLLISIDPATFKASDALGWLYQFWQSEKKKKVNDSEVKIGARELPAVTQLFTEPYMVAFLLDNSLGAWYAAPKLAGRIFDSETEARTSVAAPEIPLQYLRLVQNEDKTWTPAGGTFEQWPKNIKELTLLDPCCGSGHFLVAALLMLTPMRMELEGIDAKRAIDLILTENIHGLELDQRCVELAAFALALEAWRYPKAGGYRVLPSFHLAGVGVAPQMKKSEWLRLARAAARNLPAGNDELIPDDNPSLWENQLLTAMDQLYDTFEHAPVLGSLINPAHLSGDLLQADFSDVAKVLHDNLSNAGDEAKEAVIAAHGIIKAMELLSKKYTLVITNVPYLQRGRQDEKLQLFSEMYHSCAKSDLSTTFLDRTLDFSNGSGASCFVLPQNWLFMTSYKNIRKKLIANSRLHILEKLGAGAFETINGEVVKATLLILSPHLRPSILLGADISDQKTPAEKSVALQERVLQQVSQQQLLSVPDYAISFDIPQNTKLLSNHAKGYQGIKSGDDNKFKHFFWEGIGGGWRLSEGSLSPLSSLGYSFILDWRQGGNDYARRQGIPAFSVRGINVTNVGKIVPFSHLQSLFTSEITAVIPNDDMESAAIKAYMFSNEYCDAVKTLDANLAIATASFTKVPFDLEYWAKVAEEKYPHGLPEPFTDDPTQWIFHGHPSGSVVWDEASKRLAIGPDRVDATVLHIAVARMLGYRWPAELDEAMELAPEMREVMKRNEALNSSTDADGIVCISSIRGEQSADVRLLVLLAHAYGEHWNGTVPDQLLAACECAGKTLEYWLREKFFLQHAKLFGHRPFIWQIWDGLRDGFSVLVNYHKLDNKTLQNLIYNYLGDWITRQKSDLAHGVDGAQEKLDAAEALKKKLLLILEGEAPYDIFVRWKSLSAQPVGWNPDLNDGVRLNIRPFVTAGILREKPPKLNIKWEKDRGKDVESAPWYHLFHGDRINDHHLTLEQKKKN